MKLRSGYLLIIMLTMGAVCMGKGDEKGLLWRITGNGLKSPSYLFGTIHLQEKKLFNFPDSLYADIASCDVFSLEVNPDSMSNDLSVYLTGQFENEGTTKSKKLKDLLSDDDIATLKSNLDVSDDVKPEELTVKQMYLLKDKLKKKKKHSDEMATFMDAFLYTIAKDKGKSIAGLEHFSDQMAALSQMNWDDVDPKDMVTGLSKAMDKTDYLEQAYLEGDLVKLRGILQVLPEKMERALLSNRNKVMLRSMDSIMKMNSLFCAVGALHLPGDNGLLNMLRRAGYTVEPVICNTFTHGSDYVYTRKSLPWVDVESKQDGYSIRMPGKPSIVDAYSGVVKMNMYFDLATSKCYIVSHIPVPTATDDQTDSLMDVWADNVVAKAVDLKTKHVVHDGMRGKQYILKDKDGVNYRMELYANEKDIYLLMVYSKGQMQKDADSFFKSFKVMAKLKPRLTNKNFEDIYLTASVPDLKPTRSVTYLEDSSQCQYNYSISDPVTGCYIFIVDNRVCQGYNFSDYTLWLNNVKSIMEKKNLTIHTKKFRENGYSGDEYVSDPEGGNVLRGRLIYFGNHIYNLVVAYATTDAAKLLAESFFSSVTFNDFPKLETSVQTTKLGEIGFSTMAPHEFVRVDEDTSTVDDAVKPMERLFRSWDPSTLLTFHVTAKRLSPYYWRQKEDTVLLKQWLKMAATSSDTNVQYKFVKDKNKLVAESIASKKKSRQIHRVKVMCSGRTRYVVQTTYPEEMKNDPKMEAFFSGFKVLKQEPVKLQPSAKKFLADLRSSDSAKKHQAMEAYRELFCSASDLPALIAEYEKGYPKAKEGSEETDSEREILGYDATITQASILVSMIKGISDELTTAQVEQLYGAAQKNDPDNMADFAGMLTEVKDSVEGYRKLKKLVMDHPDAKLNDVIAKDVLNRRTLCKSLFPDWLPLVADTAVGTAVGELVTNLLDDEVLKEDDIRLGLPALIKKSSDYRRVTGGVDYNITVPNLLARIGGTAAIEELRQYQFVHNKSMNYSAAELLLQYDFVPATSTVDSLAADPVYRKSIYDLLAMYSKGELFPKKYKTQAYFAEGYMVDVSFENYKVHNFLGIKKVKYDGKKQNYYLYELKENADDIKGVLGVAGPYGDELSQLEIAKGENVTGIYDHRVKNDDLEEQVKAYLKTKEEK